MNAPKLELVVSSRRNGQPCRHNWIPVRKRFHRGWVCVRCNLWHRGRQRPQ